MVVADDDGVVVVPRADAAQVVAAAQAREDKEAAARDRYAAGEIGLDVYVMRERLARDGPDLRGPRRLPGGHRVIIDCHGHYTTAPPQLDAFRDAQLARLADPAAAPAPLADVSDDELRESVEANQLRIAARARRRPHALLPPGLGHGPPRAGPRRRAGVGRSQQRPRRPGRRAVPPTFAGVCQLPQTRRTAPLDRRASPSCAAASTSSASSACNLNPDPSGGRWTAPPLTDQSWFPLYEALVELDVPAMVHVSGSCNPAFHALGAHYLNADTTVFMQLLEGDLFDRFPTLRLVIPHGGGAVPYHWGRYRGLADRLGRPDPAELLRNVFFDTCVYHQPGIDLLPRVVPAENVLFASEMLGAVRGADPDDRRRLGRHEALPRRGWR